MKINVKIALFSSSFLILLVVTIAFFVIHDVQKRGSEQLETYRTEAYNEVRQKLRDLVDVAYETIEQNYRNLQSKRYLEKYYGLRLQNIIDTTETVLRHYADEAKWERMTLEDAQAEALATIERMRYDQGTGYIWVNDTSRPFPKMVMHPTVPALNGQVLDDPKYNTALGRDKNLFQAFNEVCERHGEGYVDYVWPKPTADGELIPDVPKLSYVRLFPEWGWIIGTGIYIDDAENDILEKIKSDVRAMRYQGGEGYFWINDNTKPFPKMVMHPTIPALDGKVLDSSEYNNAMGRDQNLFQAFVEVTERDGAGYVDYVWPKPTPEGLTEVQPKLSYVKLFEPLGWIIGSGVYVDNVDRAIEAKTQALRDELNMLIVRIIIAASAVVLLAVILSFYFAMSLARPIERLTQIAEDISLGQNLDLEIAETSRSDEIGTLAQAIDRLKTSVKIMMDRLMAG